MLDTDQEEDEFESQNMKPRAVAKSADTASDDGDALQPEAPSTSAKPLSWNCTVCTACIEAQKE